MLARVDLCCRALRALSLPIRRQTPIASRCAPDSCSMSLCRLLPCASIVTIAGKSFTVRCHIASGVPNSSSDTPSTFSIDARVELRGAADGVQIHRAVLLERRERLRAHAALADHRAHAVALDDLALIRLLANARRRTGGGDAPRLAFLHDDRTAVIQDRAVQIDRRRVLHQMRVHGVAAGEHAARDHHDVADLQRANGASVSGAFSATSRPVRTNPA